jgi:hypothetical protein
MFAMPRQPFDYHAPEHQPEDPGWGWLIALALAVAFGVGLALGLALG